MKASTLKKKVFVALGVVVALCLAGTLTLNSLNNADRHTIADYGLPAYSSLANVDSSYYRLDTLGGDFVCHTFRMGSDYEGQVYSTLVRLNSPHSHNCPLNDSIADKKSGATVSTAKFFSTEISNDSLYYVPSHRAVLYVHGFNDYFFQTEMAAKFDSAGFNFYAVDLRKYGRSMQPGQYPYDVRSIDEYFADIDSALIEIRREGNSEIVLMGHSTGGLITAMYAEANRRGPMFNALILNSPFLDMNQGWLKEKVLIPIVACVGSRWPDIRLPQGIATGYAESLLKQYHGEWTFNTDWKRPVSPPLTLGWIRAIYQAQRQVRRGLHLTVPVLVLHSDRSIYGSDWTPDFNRGDAVLDVDDIERYGRTLGPNVTTATIPGGLHDLVLSSAVPRAQTYATIFGWLKSERLN